MPVHSAGVLLYRTSDHVVHVFLAHMGGPFWGRKGAGAWTLPKGEFLPDDEDAAAAAAREFEEEVGVACPAGLTPLGEFRQSTGKIVHAFMAQGDESVEFVRSNEFDMEWPPGSGVVRSFPEVDRAEWFTVAKARTLLVKGQVPVLDALMGRLRETASDLVEE